MTLQIPLPPSSEYSEFTESSVELYCIYFGKQDTEYFMRGPSEYWVARWIFHNAIGIGDAGEVSIWPIGKDESAVRYNLSGTHLECLISDPSPEAASPGMTILELINALLATGLSVHSPVVLALADRTGADRYHIELVEEDPDNNGVAKLVRSGEILKESEVGIRD